MEKSSVATLHFFINALNNYEPGIIQKIEEQCGISRNEDLKDWYYYDKNIENEKYVFDAMNASFGYSILCEKTEKCKCNYCNYNHYARILDIKFIRNEINKYIVSNTNEDEKHKLVVYNMKHLDKSMQRYNIVDIVGSYENLYKQPLAKTNCIVIKYSPIQYEIFYSIKNTTTKREETKKYFVVKIHPLVPLP